MVFRRKFGGFKGRSRIRRAGPETYTMVQCRSELNVFGDLPCTAPIIQLTPIMVPTPTAAPTDPSTATATIGEKAKTVFAVKFQSEYLTDPGAWIDGLPCDPCPGFLAFILTIREAIMVLPLFPGSKLLPAYLPNLTSNEQSFDTADRVLWKRIVHMPMWGLNTTGGVPQLQTTVRDTAAGPVVVKSSARLDDRHGLFFVRNYYHDLALGIPADPTTRIPVQWDAWFKTFWKPRFR